MKCTECESNDAVETRFSWEMPPGRYGFGDSDEEERINVAPLRVLCHSCIDRHAREHLAANPIAPDDAVNCPRCEMTVKRGDMRVLAKARGGALLCPNCYAIGLLPHEKRGDA